MIYPNKPLYLLSLLGYIYRLTYYTLTTKDNIIFPPSCDYILKQAKRKAYLFIKEVVYDS